MGFRGQIVSAVLGLAACVPAVGGQELARACVTDGRGRPLAGVVVLTVSAGENAGVTGADGCVALGAAATGTRLQAGLKGYAGASVTSPAPGTTVTLILRAEDVQQTVTVTAERGLPGTDTWTPSVLGLSLEELQQAPGLALDDRLRQVAGFELFRRTSSWTANPTSQGVSLRGLGSTAASRTLVVSDQVPLNDAFGGWVHWNEIPSLAVNSVSLLRGGAADLYGSSAIGGVIDVVPARAPRDLRVSADASGATENSALGDGLISGGSRYGSGLAALSVAFDGRLCSDGSGCAWGGGCGFECGGRERAAGAAHGCGWAWRHGVSARQRHERGPG